jgi:hypothetical protein
MVSATAKVFLVVFDKPKLNLITALLGGTEATLACFSVKRQNRGVLIPNRRNGILDAVIKDIFVLTQELFVNVADTPSSPARATPALQNSNLLALIERAIIMGKPAPPLVVAEQPLLTTAMNLKC